MGQIQGLNNGRSGFKIQGQTRGFLHDIQSVNWDELAPDTWYCMSASAPTNLNGDGNHFLVYALISDGTQVVHVGGHTMGVFETQEEADKFTCGLSSACPAGLYRGGCADSSPCIPCGAGKYKAGNDAAGTCIDCQVGKYSNVSGATTCVDCGYEKYSDTTGASSQSACKDCKTCPVRVNTVTHAGSLRGMVNPHLGCILCLSVASCAQPINDLSSLHTDSRFAYHVYVTLGLRVLGLMFFECVQV